MFHGVLFLFKIKVPFFVFLSEVFSLSTLSAWGPTVGHFSYFSQKKTNIFSTLGQLKKSFYFFRGWLFVTLYNRHTGATFTPLWGEMVNFDRIELCWAINFLKQFICVRGLCHTNRSIILLFGYYDIMSDLILATDTYSLDDIKINS